MVRWIMLLLLCVKAWADPANLKDPANLRIGILSFQDSHDLQQQIRQQAQILKASLHLTPAFAIGTYGELFHWLENDLIDVAVVNSGQVALLSPEKWQYLGSNITSQRQSNTNFVFLARTDSGLKSLDQLKTHKTELRLIAVDPLSISGFIAPILTLHQNGIDLTPEQISFSYSHSNSLRWLGRKATTPDKTDPATVLEVACVWASTWEQSQNPLLHEITLPTKTHYPILPVALIARKGAATTVQLSQLVNSGKFPGFSYNPGYMQEVARLPKNLPNGLANLSGRPLDRVGLDDLVMSLHHYNVTHKQPARFAVVLAGGGAKCSYQIGAVRALQENLQSWKQRLHDPNLNINLVVGTSGGAINALAVALGLTDNNEGYQALCQAWLDLDQGEIICPPLAVRINLWLWLACIAGLATLSLNRLLGLNKTHSMMLTGLVGGLMLLLSYSHLRFLLGRDANLQHLWAWLSWGIGGAGTILIGMSLIGQIMLARDRRHNQTIHHSKLLIKLAIAGVTILPVIQAWIMFGYEEVVSENHGLESALQRNFSRLIQHQNKGVADTSQLSISQLSQLVFQHKLLKKDVVLTASPLSDPQLKLPGEFYFFSSVADTNLPNFGNRGVNLKQRPAILFDALLGSAAIYPLFPSRSLKDLPQAGQKVDLVDGSFAHRSPLEPAVLWGATHVLIVEASTLEPTIRGNLLANFAASLTYLYDEAQLVDLRLRGQTALYTLYPGIPHIGLLDFSPFLIQSSIDKGYQEASGKPTSLEQKGGVLHKELGLPGFWIP